MTLKIHSGVIDCIEIDGALIPVDDAEEIRAEWRRRGYVLLRTTDNNGRRSEVWERKPRKENQ